MASDDRIHLRKAMVLLYLAVASMSMNMNMSKRGGREASGLGGPEGYAKLKQD
jgi:hypothetical protein